MTDAEILKAIEEKLGTVDKRKWNLWDDDRGDLLTEGNYFPPKSEAACVILKCKCLTTGEDQAKTPSESADSFLTMAKKMEQELPGVPLYFRIHQQPGMFILCHGKDKNKIKEYMGVIVPPPLPSGPKMEGMYW